MSKTILIDDWSIEYGEHTLYTAPELIHVHLKGYARNHPKLGTSWIRTSPIVLVKGRLVKTKSGSTYKLGEINPGYKKWLLINFPDWDELNPIKMKG